MILGGQGSARSPWRLGELPVVFGEELPPILRHHVHPVSWGLARRWRPITNNDGTNKPRGGLFCAPALPRPGVWRPIPRRSAWTEWCEEEMPHWINGHYQTQLYPHRQAAFARIDSARDARVLYAHFPNDNHPVSVALREGVMASGMWGKMIDWSALMARGISGVYMTARGERETRLPDDPETPSLYGWDAATLWFSRRAFTVGKTWKSPRVNPDPYEMGWPEGGYTREESRERLRAAADQAREFMDSRWEEFPGT